MADAHLACGSPEALAVDGSGDSEPRTEGGGVVCGCGHVHRRREVADRGGLSRGCPVRADHGARHRFLHSRRGVSEQEAFLQRRRARRQARAAASLTDSSTTLSFGLNDDGNGTEDRNQGAVNNGDIENNEQNNGIEVHASETEEEGLLQTLKKRQTMGRELREGTNKKKRPSRTESDEQHDLWKGCSEHDVRRFRKRIETAAHSLPCCSCGAVPDPT